MLHILKKEFQDLRHDAPGERFRRHYERQHARRESRWRRMLWIAFGLLLITIGTLMSLPPGLPGFVFAIPGFGIIASRFLTSAVVLDRIEIMLWRHAPARLKTRIWPNSMGDKVQSPEKPATGKAREQTMNDRTTEQKPKEPHEQPDPVDETSDESFPASDSPSWTPVDHPGTPDAERRKDKYDNG